MQPYPNNGSGITGYEAGDDFIKIRFADGGIYLYTYDKPGKEDVDFMKKLAEAGSGLTTYINRYVREKYAERLR